MRKILIGILLLSLLILPVFAEGTSDQLQEGIPDEAQELMPQILDDEAPDFAVSLKKLLQNAFHKVGGSFREALKLCSLLLCIVILCAMVETVSRKNSSFATRVVGALGICAAVAGSFQTMISMASDTIEQISNYSSMLLPVLASASAMSGGLSSASALYAGTIFFSQLLLRLITKILIPGVYFYLAVSTAEAAIGGDMLESLREFIGWLISKSLRIMLFIFVVYMAVTGVISGSADAAAVKATKAAVSSMIPVVGSILSDASESMLAGASLVKNSAGVIGMLVVIAICIIPLLRIGIHYLLMKITAAAGGTLGSKEHVNLLKRFSEAMGYLFAMSGTSGLLMLVSTICFMKVMT